MANVETLITKLHDMIGARGGDLYGGEAITQAQHALQCAQLAEDAGASKPLITAALLHDIGHLLEHDFEAALEREEDRFHENMGDTFLKQWFGLEVTEPVRLHVASKRYLCATDPDYFAKLSPASVHTLRIQGGPMSTAEVKEFETNDNYREAVRLRIWDDLGKDPEMKTASLEHFLDIVREVAETA